MSAWLTSYTNSQKYAGKAEYLRKTRRIEESTQMFLLAAQEEERALNSVSPGNTKRVATIVVKCASLYVKADNPEKAKEIAEKYLSDKLPVFVLKQLKEIVRWCNKSMKLSISEELILRAICDRTMYGLEIKQAISECCGHDIGYGSLYPSLNKLTEKELIEKVSSVVVKGKNRDYYRLTKSGVDAVNSIEENYTRLKYWKQNK
ncbi:MAG: PadR family transcriptional regulator [Dolichospermum sp.]